MKKINCIFLLFVFLSGCSNQAKKSERFMSPIQVIEYSAAAAPESVNGLFKMTVKAGNLRDRMVFLNSELDYRDQRNLSIVLRPSLILELTKKYGKNPLDYLINKTIIVQGEAKRMKIWMFYKTKKLKKYYYQTHVFIDSMDQISIYKK